MASSAKKLTPKQAHGLLEAEQEVERLRAMLKLAELDRDEVRASIRARVPLSVEDDERQKKIRTATVGGVRIRVTPAQSGARFSLSQYRAAGHVVTPEMKEAITPGKSFDRWTVKPPADDKT